MPENTIMISNEAALREGFARAAWKRNICLEYFRNVNYKVSAITPFDDRDLHSLIPLLVDISSVIDKSEDEKKAYFLAQLQIIERDFVLTKDPSTRLPYLRRMYEEVRTDYDIDWNDPAQIDHLVCSTASQQMIATMGVKMPQEVFSLFPTKNEAQRLDSISMKNFINTRKFQNAVSRFDPDLNRQMGLGGVNEECPNTKIQDDITLAFAKAYDDGSNVAMLDPTAVSDFTKKLLLGDDIEEDYIDNYDEEVHFDRNDAIYEFIGRCASVSMQTVNEFMTTELYSSVDNKYNFLFINGRSAKDLVSEKMKRENIGDVAAKRAVGEMVRNALVDGKSIVSLMRPVVLEGGKVSFSHQEIKVDLDKLNKIERKEKHNIFRRILHAIGIRIPNKYPSNEARENYQSAIKGDLQYQATMKKAEKDFITAYNQHSLKTREKELENERKAQQKGKGETVAKNKFLNAFPEISNVIPDSEHDELNQSIYNDPEKVRLTSIMEDLQEDEEYEFSEAIDENELDKSKEFESNVK